jgi:signal transduction histidine kinase
MEERSQRKLAEAALQLRSLELGRAVRFSADASHQLKTPLTVLRAGLEALLARHSLGVEIREELAALVHQTFRLNGVIEDLLLLSRMDAGCLRVNLTSVDLTAIIEGFSDDLTALPDAPTIHLEMSSSRLEIAGEKRYIELIMQNLLENAWKYNRPGGEIRIRCFQDGNCVKVIIGNTGPQIPCEARETIFERFHRAAIGENIPGHGLGLNLARELLRREVRGLFPKREDAGEQHQADHGKGEGRRLGNSLDHKLEAAVGERRSGIDKRGSGRSCRKIRRISAQHGGSHRAIKAEIQG